MSVGFGMTRGIDDDEAGGSFLSLVRDRTQRCTQSSQINSVEEVWQEWQVVESGWETKD